MDDFQKLVRDASVGDDAALHELLERNLSALHAFVRLQTGDALSAKESPSDLVQSVCREVLEDLGDFEYRGEKAFKHWLFTTALRKVIDRSRFHFREKRDIAREARPLELSDGDTRGLLDCYGTFCTPSRDAIAREELERIERAFSQLDPHYRELITLCRIVGLTYAEAGEQTDRTADQVRGLVTRGLARLARILSTGG